MCYSRVVVLGFLAIILPGIFCRFLGAVAEFSTPFDGCAGGPLGKMGTKRAARNQGNTAIMFMFLQC